jgi:hypothetical protein
MKAESGQLRRWLAGYGVNDGGLFMVLERMSPEFIDSHGGPSDMPAWSMLIDGVWDWMYEVDLEEMSGAVDG